MYRNLLVILNIDSLQRPVQNETTSSCTLSFNAVDYEKYTLQVLQFRCGVEASWLPFVCTRSW